MQAYAQAEFAPDVREQLLRIYERPGRSERWSRTAPAVPAGVPAPAANRRPDTRVSSSDRGGVFSWGSVRYFTEHW